MTRPSLPRPAVTHLICCLFEEQSKGTLGSHQDYSPLESPEFRISSPSSELSETQDDWLVNGRGSAGQCMTCLPGVTTYVLCNTQWRRCRNKSAVKLSGLPLHPETTLWLDS